MARSKTTKIARRRPVRAQSESDMRMELAALPATFAGMLGADIKIRSSLRLPPVTAALHRPAGTCSSSSTMTAFR
jgi:hypothetical protein